MSSKSFGEIISRNNGVGPGFDLLRVGLAITILAAHCSGLNGTRGLLSSLLQDLLQFIWPTPRYTEAVRQIAATAVTTDITVDRAAVTGPARPFTLSHVPMFFALSGFLVAGSAFRTKKLVPFLALRICRILPALLVEVTLSAIVLGAIFTTLPLPEYYTSGEFVTYFGNILGIVQYTLPGVSFNGNPIVNANLWTLPSEFHCYALTALLIVTSLLFGRVVFTILLGLATVVLITLNMLFGHDVTLSHLPGDVNVYYFFVGMAFFMWRDKIPYSFWLFVVCVLASYVLMFSTRTVYLYPIMLVYITVFLGLTAFPKIPLLQSGDYSYGIYLYGFPITQALMTAVPALRGHFVALFVAAVCTTTFCAVLSWHFVEKPFLRLRRYFSPQSARIAEQLHPELKAERGTRGRLTPTTLLGQARSYLKR